MASGPGSFENDDALEWVDDLEDSFGITMLQEAFTRVEKNKYPDSVDCCVALAAAEVVAAAKGKPSPDLPAGVRSWLEEEEDADSIKSLDKAAIKVVNKIRNNSELKESWQDTDDWQEWQRVLNKLEERLRG